MANSQDATIDAIEGCCTRIEAMCDPLDEAGWHRPTALPRWDVQDVVAHLGSLDGMFLGHEEPAHEPAFVDHVRNPLGHLNERMVDRRRAWSGAEVLAEFRATTGERIAALRDLDETGLEREVPSPRGGLVPLSAFLGTRLWDFLVHDLDIAEALGHDLGPTIESPAGRRVLDEMLMLLPRAAAKGGAPDGSVVVLELTGSPARTTAVRVDGGRGHLAGPAEEATLHLRASPAVFLRVGSGRRDPAGAVAAGDVHVQGDAALAAAILSAVNVVP